MLSAGGIGLDVNVPGILTFMAVLTLEAPSTADGPPRAIGEPEHVVRVEETWHVHNGGWSPDSKRIVCMHDRDDGDIYGLVKREQAP